MRFVRRAGVVLITATMSLGLLGITATSADADTGWGHKAKVVTVFK